MYYWIDGWNEDIQLETSRSEASNVESEGAPGRLTRKIAIELVPERRTKEGTTTT